MSSCSRSARSFAQGSARRSLALKEKLKTVSEELEDFVEVSCAVDIFKSDVGRAALSGVWKGEGSSVGTAAAAEGTSSS